MQVLPDLQHFRLDTKMGPMFMCFMGDLEWKAADYLHYRVSTTTAVWVVLLLYRLCPQASDSQLRPTTTPAQPNLFFSSLLPYYLVSCNCRRTDPPPPGSQHRPLPRPLFSGGQVTDIKVEAFGGSMHLPAPMSDNDLRVFAVGKDTAVVRSSSGGLLLMARPQ
jgi:hypothetical protein